MASGSGSRGQLKEEETGSDSSESSRSGIGSGGRSGVEETGSDSSESSRKTSGSGGRLGQEETGSDSSESSRGRPGSGEKLIREETGSDSSESSRSRSGSGERLGHEETGSDSSESSRSRTGSGEQLKSEETGSDSSESSRSRSGSGGRLGHEETGSDSSKSSRSRTGSGEQLKSEETGSDSSESSRSRSGSGGRLGHEETGSDSSESSRSRTGSGEQLKSEETGSDSSESSRSRSGSGGRLGHEETRSDSSESSRSRTGSGEQLKSEETGSDSSESSRSRSGSGERLGHEETGSDSSESSRSRTGSGEQLKSEETGSDSSESSRSRSGSGGRLGHEETGSDSSESSRSRTGSGEKLKDEETGSDSSESSRSRTESGRRLGHEETASDSSESSRSRTGSREELKGEETRSDSSESSRRRTESWRRLGEEETGSNTGQSSRTRTGRVEKLGYKETEPKSSERSQSTRSDTSAKSFLAPDDPFSENLAAQSRREEDVELLRWAALEKLPSYDRLRTTVLSKNDDQREDGYEQVDVRKAGPELNKKLLNKLFERGTEEDNADFLLKIRNRLDKVDLKLPTVEVRFENLSLEADCQVGDRFLPTLPNALFNFMDRILSVFNLGFAKNRHLTILREISGILRPSRMTLLLGPPGSGRTSLLLALAASLQPGIKQRGRITYNGHTFDEFTPLKTSAYIGQNDLHAGELTVRETLDYASRYLGVGSRYDLLSELVQREKELGIHPDPDIDFYMKATALEGVSHDFMTQYIIKILGLEICADTFIGDDMRRGISGGQKKRVTIGELLVGPSRTLFMDEITNGLDSSTAFQIITILGQFAHILDMTIFITLLQPAPEIFELFDDIILLSEGQIVYHGPRENVEEFFASCGFKCPPRKGIADFLQEVTSRKDQTQYWADKSKPYQYVSVDSFSRAYKQFHAGVKLHEELATPYCRSKSHKAALVFQQWALSQKDLLKITFEKEMLLLKRDWFIYTFRTFQVMLQALLIASVFFRTEMHRDTFDDAQVFSGAIFTNALTVMFSGFADIAILVVRLPVFYKHRDMKMLPAWAFGLSTLLSRLPISIIESTAYLALTYYPMGFAPNAGRFFRELLIYTTAHLMASSLYRVIAGVCRTLIVATSFGALVLTMVFMLGGFTIPRSRFKDWWIWGYWISPLSWTMIGLSETEFLAPQWNNQIIIPGDTTTLGRRTLHLGGYYPHGYWYWTAIGVIVLLIFAYNIFFNVALTYTTAPGRSRAVMSEATLAGLQANWSGQQLEHKPGISGSASRKAVPSSTKLITLGSDNSVSTRKSPSTEDTMKTDFELTASKASGSSSARSLTPSRSTPRTSNSRAIVREGGRVPGRRGMVLPFQPLSISFKNISYFVDMPSEMRHRGATEDKLQLLSGISGAFRPGILTALVGVTGAGKSTLMDVLLGRKTKGIVEGDIHISGFPKNQKTFARISGYCEQNDVHSPRLTVHESVIFSAELRLPQEVEQGTKKQFVEEVLELVELASLRNSIVGLPAMYGLSTEQRKRLSIAVELVANPSIIFMDEPTSGLDARAAAIVMRAVRNTVDTGRTVVCTIHQPSIDIFESFDELLLLKLGGKAIYGGPLGRESQELVKYLQDIPGIPQIKNGSNPATWMLEVTTIGMERKLGMDFAEIYKNSPLYQRNLAIVEELSQPPPGTRSLSFPTQYSQPARRQLLSCLWKHNKTYWRTPEYNNVRYFYSIFIGLFFGTMFWHVGQSRSSQFSILEVMGAIYAAGLLTGILMGSSVQGMIGTERTVFYREHAAGMYAAVPYALAHIIIEIPYTFVQAILYSLITYSTINLEWKADKFFLYLYYTFLVTILYSYYGMMTVALTPNVQLASILSGLFYNVWNLFSGFIIRKPRIPVWWSWYYWATPLAWHIYGSIIAQFGDLNDEYVHIEGQGDLSLPYFIRRNFGFRHSWLGLTIAMTAVFPVMFAAVYVLAIKYISFQNR